MRQIRHKAKVYPKQPFPKESLLRVKKGEDRTLSQKLLSSFKSIDLYGEGVSLTYKGQSKFSTIYGALGTLILALIITGYSSSRVQTLVHKKSPKITKSTFQRDLAQQDTVYPFELGFGFAFGFSFVPDPALATYVAYYKVYEIENAQETEAGIWDVNRTYYEEDLEFQNCNSQLLNYSNWTEAQYRGIESYQCITNQNISLQGNYFSSTFSFIELGINACQNTTNSSTCRSPEEIEAFFDRGYFFNVIILNSYFDLDSYEEPIKHFIDDKLEFQTRNSKEQKANLFLQHDEAVLMDDPYLTQEYELKFISAQNSYLFESSVWRSRRVSAFIRMDSAYSVNNRVVYTLLDMLGDIGGLNSILYLLISMIVKGWTKTILTSKIIKNLFQVELEQTSERDSYKLAKEVEFGNQPSEKFMKQILAQMMNRIRFKISVLKQLKYSYCPCKSKLSGLKYSDNRGRQRQIYKNSIKLLSKELDIVKIIRELRESRQIQQIILSQSKRLMLRFQRSNVIDSHSSTSDSDNENQQVIKLLHHKNPVIRFYQLKKLVRSTSDLQKKKMKTVDKNILKGVFMKRLKDSQAKEKEFQQLTLFERLTQELAKKKGADSKRLDSASIFNRGFENDSREDFTLIQRQSYDRRKGLMSHVFYHGKESREESLNF